jgi:hypothetical protein
MSGAFEILCFRLEHQGIHFHKTENPHKDCESVTLESGRAINLHYWETLGNSVEIVERLREKINYAIR